MNPLRRTLTTIGLSIRDEMRVKSMLQIVEGKTSASWSYVDEAQADLMLYEPESALAQTMIKLAVRNGRPRCVVLLRQGVQALPDAHCVFAPLRVSDFISLLDEVIESPLPVRTHKAGLPRSAPEPAPNAVLLEHLQRIIADKDERAHCITIGTTNLIVMLNQQSVLANEPLTPEHVATLVSRQDIAARILPDHEIATLEDHIHRCPLSVLLWNCAIAAADTRPWSPPGTAFSLKRWPDFGRLTHRPWHIRLTALLAREAFTAQQMSVMIEQPLPQIHAFLHACDLIRLLVTSTAIETHSPRSMDSSATVAAESSSRWSSIFQSFRQALNMGRR